MGNYDPETVRTDLNCGSSYDPCVSSVSRLVPPVVHGTCTLGRLRGNSTNIRTTKYVVTLSLILLDPRNGKNNSELSE